MRQLMQSAALLVMVLQVACSSSPTARFYTLSSAVNSQHAESVAPYSVSISTVTVPDMVNRPQIVTRSGTNQVTMNEFARWGEPLKSEIPRVIANNLTGLLDGAHVTAYPQNANPDTDYRVTVDVLRFDSVFAEAATIEVLWTVKAPKGGPQKTGRSGVREVVSGTGYEELVAAHSRALASVSRDIAAAVRAVRATQ